MELHILDCSQYIYAGSYGISTSRSSGAKISRGVRETDGVYGENSAPIGGVRFLINQAAALCGEDRVVMPVFDRTPNIKREMYKDAFGSEYGYKGNRKAAGSEIHLQKDYAYAIMDKLGYPVQAATDYESDDLIYTIVNMYRNDYERIFVHCNDSDLYFLVGGNVCVDMVGSKVGKLVTEANYPQVVDKDGWCPYNVHHIRKLCMSDRSDNIPGIGSDWMPRFDEVIPTDELRKLGDLDLCREYLKEAVNRYPTAANAHMVLRTFNILVPLLVPDYLINDREPDVDYEKQRYFTSGWKQNMDKWGFEEDLLAYIDSYYE